MNAPIPPVMMTALATMTVPSEPVTVTGPSSGAVSSTACSPSTYVGENGAAEATRFSTRIRPLTAVYPATSKMSFSGYIAVICPPASGSASITTTDHPRNPA